MTLPEVMTRLAALGTEQTKKTLMRHGAPEPLAGVRVADLQPLRKQLKGKQELAMELYATGHSDAMYLAGLIADGAKMTVPELDAWAAGAKWHLHAGTTVPSVAAEHPEGMACAERWIASADAMVATSGWSTLAALVSTVPDDALPVGRLKELLDRAVRALPKAPDRVRYAMNGYVIACGAYCEPAASHALGVARAIGKVKVDMGRTACKVPDAEDYIARSRRDGKAAPKRKTVRC